MADGKVLRERREPIRFGEPIRVTTRTKIRRVEEPQLKAIVEPAPAPVREVERRLTKAELLQKQLELRGLPSETAERLAARATTPRTREIRGITVVPGAITEVSPGVEALIEQRRKEQLAAQRAEEARRLEEVPEISAAEFQKRFVEGRIEAAPGAKIEPDIIVGEVFGEMPKPTSRAEAQAIELEKEAFRLRKEGKKGLAFLATTQAKLLRLEPTMGRAAISRAEAQAIELEKIAQRLDIAEPGPPGLTLRGIGSQLAQAQAELLRVESRPEKVERIAALGATGLVLAPLVVAAGPVAAIGLGVLGTAAAALGIPSIREAVGRAEDISPQAKREFLLARAAEAATAIGGFKLGARLATPSDILAKQQIGKAKAEAQFKLKLKFEKELTKGLREQKSIEEVFRGLEAKGKITETQLELFTGEPEVSPLTLEQIRKAEEEKFLTFKAKGRKPEPPIPEKTLEAIRLQLKGQPIDLDAKVSATRQAIAERAAIEQAIKSLPPTQQVAIADTPVQLTSSQLRDIATGFIKLRLAGTLEKGAFFPARQPPRLPGAGAFKVFERGGATRQVVLLEEQLLGPQPTAEQVLDLDLLLGQALASRQAQIATQIVTPITGLLSMLGLRQEVIPTVQQVQVQEQLPRVTTAQILAQQQIQQQLQRQRLAQVQVPVQVQVPMLDVTQIQEQLQLQVPVTEQITRQILEEEVIPIPAAPPIQISLPEIGEAIRPRPTAPTISAQGFDVLVKRKRAKLGRRVFKGRGFRKVNTQTLTRLAALGLGASIVDTFTNRSFKIRKSNKLPVQRPDLVSKWLLLQRKFRAAKRNKNTLVERSRFAIDHPLEVAGIPLEAARLRRLGLIQTRRRVQSNMLVTRVRKQRARRRANNNLFFGKAKGKKALNKFLS